MPLNYLSFDLLCNVVVFYIYRLQHRNRGELNICFTFPVENRQTLIVSFTTTTGRPYTVRG